MIGNLIKPELTNLIHERQFAQLREVLCEFLPADIAEIFVDLEAEDKAVMLRVLPNDLAADVFEHLSVDDQESLLLALGNETVAQILNEMDPDDRTAFFEELPAVATRKLLNLLSPKERSIAVSLLGYPEDSIGRRMTPEYIAIDEDWTVAQVLEHLRKFGHDKESLHQLYVVNARRQLTGVVLLDTLVVTDLASPVADLIEHQVATLGVLDDQETAIEAFLKYDLTILPVVNSGSILLGVVTVDDVLDVVEEEYTEDIQKMAAVEVLEAPYMDVGIFSLIRKRAGWLVVLFFGQIGTIFVLRSFEHALAQVTVLMLFIPLLISCGGNSGSQASTLIIRAMATHDIDLSDWWRVLRRELFSGVSFGLVLAVMSLGVIRIVPNLTALNYWKVSAVVGFSLIGVVVFGCMVGGMLPFVLQLCKLDPAVCSGPLVATLVDVSGLMIYFVIAKAILGGLVEPEVESAPLLDSSPRSAMVGFVFRGALWLARGQG